MSEKLIIGIHNILLKNTIQLLKALNTVHVILNTSIFEYNIKSNLLQGPNLGQY